MRARATLPKSGRRNAHRGKWRPETRLRVDDVLEAEFFCRVPQGRAGLTRIWFPGGGEFAAVFEIFQRRLQFAQHRFSSPDLLLNFCRRSVAVRSIGRRWNGGPGADPHVCFSKLFDADIYRNQLCGALLFDPVAGMRVADDLPRFLMDVILGRARIGVLQPTPKFHISPDLRRGRMPSFDVLHAGDDAGLLLIADWLNEDAVDPDIEGGDKRLKQAP